MQVLTLKPKQEANRATMTRANSEGYTELQKSDGTPKVPVSMCNPFEAHPQYP